MEWTFHHPLMTPQHMGYLPAFFSEQNRRPAIEQLDQGYKHGGGFRQFKGLSMSTDKSTLHYPGDPPFRLLASAFLRKELLLFYEHDILAIVQPDGSWVAARVD